MLIDFRKLFPRYKINPNGILHLGSNIGEEASVYDELGIKNVHWIEANPEIHSKLVDNVKKYGHKTYCFAVGDENKSVTFHVSNNASQSSSVLELGTHKLQHPDVHYVKDIQVEMCRIEDFFKPEPTEGYYNLQDVDFLNADLQGFECQALRGMGNLLHQFKWIYTELNKAQVYKGCTEVGDMDLFLNGFGFKRVETAHWIGDWSDGLYIKNHQ